MVDGRIGAVWTLGPKPDRTWTRTWGFCNNDSERESSWSREGILIVCASGYKAKKALTVRQ